MANDNTPDEGGLGYDVEGEAVDYAVLKLSGGVPARRAFYQGEHVVLAVRGRIEKYGFKRDKDDHLVREHTLKLIGVVEPEKDLGETLLKLMWDEADGATSTFPGQQTFDDVAAEEPISLDDDDDNDGIEFEGIEDLPVGDWAVEDDDDDGEDDD